MCKLFTKRNQVLLTTASFGTVMAPILAFADTNEAVTAAQSLLNNVTSTLNITNIVAIVSVGLSGAVGLYLAWWGARKLVKMLMAAFQKGKIKL